MESQLVSVAPKTLSTHNENKNKGVLAGSTGEGDTKSGAGAFQVRTESSSGSESAYDNDTWSSQSNARLPAPLGACRQRTSEIVSEPER